MRGTVPGGPAQPPHPTRHPLLLPCAPLTLPQPLIRAVAHPRPPGAGGRSSGGGQVRSLPAKSPRAAHATAVSPGSQPPEAAWRLLSRPTPAPSKPARGSGGAGVPALETHPRVPTRSSRPRAPGRGCPRRAAPARPRAVHGCARTDTRPRRAHARLHKARGHRRCSALHLDGHAAAPAPLCAPRAPPRSSTPRTPQRCYPAPPARSPRPRRPRRAPAAPQIHPHAPWGWLPSPPAPRGPRELGAEASRGAPSPACCPAAPMPAARWGASGSPTTGPHPAPPSYNHGEDSHSQDTQRFPIVPPNRGVPSPSRAPAAPYSCSSGAGAAAGPPPGITPAFGTFQFSDAAPPHSHGQAVLQLRSAHRKLQLIPAQMAPGPTRRGTRRGAQPLPCPAPRAAF